MIQRRFSVIHPAQAATDDLVKRPRSQQEQAARLASGGLRLYGTAISGRLAVSRNLAEANGGRIEVESDGVPGKGSTFTVCLPTRETALGFQRSEQDGKDKFRL